MIVWLARHAEAVNPDQAPADAVRPLTEAGRRQMTQLGCWLKDRVQHPDLILHSPLVRAAQTAEILRNEFGIEIPLKADPLLAPGLSSDRLLASLSSRAVERVLCVGHQPDIGRCLNEVLGGGRFAISPGVIACVEFPQIIARGGGQLRWLLSPGFFG